MNWRSSVIGLVDTILALCLLHYSVRTSALLSHPQMPLGLIEEVELQHRKEDLVVLCKDARSFR